MTNEYDKYRRDSGRYGDNIVDNGIADYSRSGVESRYGTRTPQHQRASDIDYQPTQLYDSVGNAPYQNSYDETQKQKDNEAVFDALYGDAADESMKLRQPVVPRQVPSSLAPASKKNKKGGKWKVVLAILLALLVGLGIWVWSWYSEVEKNLHGQDVSAVTVPSTPGQPYYMLLLGSDSRDAGATTSRADSIMLCRIDESNKKATIISLPRDLRVEIEGHGMDKLNASLAYGGVPLCIKTVSQFASVPISYYATIYFDGFSTLVDDLHGVNVEVPEGTELDGVAVLAGSSVEINGEQALVLARCRHGNYHGVPDSGPYAQGDFQRTLNQRNLMKAIAKKSLSQPMYELPGTIVSVSKCVETNMSPIQLASLVFAMKGMDTDKDMYLSVVPSYADYIGGVSYVIAYDDQWANMMTKVKAGQDPNL